MTSCRGFPRDPVTRKPCSILNAASQILDLRSASIERMAMGLPRMISGNFASVFPMTSASGHKYAVKCFTRPVSHQLDRYQLISAHLGTLRPWWSTDFQFIPEGIQVDGARYPILRMNWVQGLTLTRWVSENVHSRLGPSLTCRGGSTERSAIWPPRGWLMEICRPETCLSLTTRPAASGRL